MAETATSTVVPALAPVFVLGAVPRSPTLRSLAEDRRRAGIAAEIEMCLLRVDRLIARLDSMDEDCDLEDDDPAGDFLDERGEAPSDDGSRILPDRPVYRMNQARVPLNRANAIERYLSDQEGR